MSTASLVMIVLSALTTAAGLPCCLGCVNYLAVPLSMATVLVGLAGLAFDKDPATGTTRDLRIHLLAIVLGVLFAAVGFVRCVAGGGCV
jgi:hypothetical protein